MVNSPCIKRCEFDKENQICTGCFRTLEELRKWRTMTDPEKAAALNRILLSESEAVKMKKVEAYKCSSCRKIFLKEASAIACENRHNKKRRIARAAASKKNKIECLRSEFKNSLTSLEQFCPALESLAEKLGYGLKISISSSQIKLHHSSHCIPGGYSYRYDVWKDKDDAENERLGNHLAYKIRVGGKFTQTRNGKLGKVYEPLRSSYTKGVAKSFCDFISYFVSGVYTRSGCENSGSFGYDMIMFISDFPNINEFNDLIPYRDHYEDYIKLKRCEKKFLARKSELSEEYKEYFYFKRFSDPAWASRNAEIKRLDSEMISIRERKDILSKKINIISKDLDDERPARTTPEEKYSFDRELFLRMRKYYK